MTTKARLYLGVMGRSAARRRGRAASAFHVCCSVMVPSPQSQNGSSNSSSTPSLYPPLPPHSFAQNVQEVKKDPTAVGSAGGFSAEPPGCVEESEAERIFLVEGELE